MKGGKKGKRMERERKKERKNSVESFLTKNHLKDKLCKRDTSCEK